MSELRKDYLLNKYVVVATDRAKRPDQFASSEPHNEKPEVDFFALGNETMTPNEKGRLGDNPWRMRWFENKFPITTLKHVEGLDVNPQTHNDFYTFANAFGVHEVVVETNDDRQIYDLEIHELVDLLKVYSTRVKELSCVENIKYVQVFKNHGPKAGCSVWHSHSQIVAFNILPPAILDEEAFAKKFMERTGLNPFDEIIKRERNSSREIVYDGKTFTFCPYASEFPFEAKIFPLRNVINICDLDDSEIGSLAKSMKIVLNKLKEVNVPFNIFFRNGLEYQRFYVDIAPRPNIWAGFELSTGIIVNPVPPEDAARFYKGE
ncbi:DUF4931 domain-containing protein [Candidatus Woesearchaeota archaeon]|nr:DUF4931 domain-containing protein [Candidatus Woesearchaeota archaeon]